MTTQDPELSAALGWPGGTSDPVLDRKTLLQMVAALMQDKLWEDHRVRHLWDHAQQAEPVQEPVAKCIDDICSEHLGRVEAFDHLPKGTLLYTIFPRRTMVPLTDGEIDALPWFGSPRQFARAVEQASWEKNHG